MNSYELSRKFFDYCFDNPEKVKPNHIALYFFAIEHCNRLGWKEKFGLPTEMTKSAIGIHSYNTYTNTLKDLIDWGFIKLVKKSVNQYSSNIIALSNFNKAHNNPLDKAIVKHDTKQEESTGESIDTINKQLTTNKEQDNKELLFERFWNLYDKKVETKKCKEKFLRLKDAEIEKIFLTLPDYIKSTPDVKFRKNPSTYLNNQCWNDEIVQPVAEYKHNGVRQSPTDGAPDGYYISANGQLIKISTD